MNNIIVICQNENCGKKLKESTVNLDFNVEIEVQNKNHIINKISEEKIKEAKAILFVVDKGIEKIKEVERFIDIEYYEVEPCIAINHPDQVISEIISDLK